MIHINPAMILVVPAVRVVGGKRTATKTVKEQKNGQALNLTKQTVIEYDNRDERKQAEDFAQRARNMARQLATYTPLGYLASEDARPQLEDKIKALKAEGAKLNKSLGTCQVQTEIALLKMEVSVTAEIATLVNNHIREDLEQLRTAIAGGATDARNVFNRTRNIASLAVGIQSDAIKFALEEAKAAIKTGKAVTELPHLDNAITLFSPADALAMPEPL